MAGRSRRRAPPVQALESRPWTAESRALSDDFPETAANNASIRKVQEARADMIRHALADGWTEDKQGWKKISGGRMRTGEVGSWGQGFFDASIRSSDLRNDELEATLESYGGRGHGKTVARLMSVGAHRSAGVDSLSFSLPRNIEERVYRAPKSALDPTPSEAPSTAKANINPLAARGGGKQRKHASRSHATQRNRSAENGVSSPLSRLIKMPTSPLSPVRDASSASPLSRSGMGSFKGAHSPVLDGFAKGRPRAVANVRQQQTDSMIASMLGPETGASPCLPGMKFGDPVSKGGHYLGKHCGKYI